MGQSEAESMSALRFSVGEDNDEAQIDRAIDAVKQVVASLRRL
jgi:cysteine sulfinate desulfinase/cysteine desulfurase-like protein